MLDVLSKLTSHHGSDSHPTDYVVAEDPVIPCSVVAFLILQKTNGILRLCDYALRLGSEVGALPGPSAVLGTCRMAERYAMRTMSSSAIDEDLL